MLALFDTEVKLTVNKDFEKNIKEVDDATRTLLAQCVKRVEPSLKFA